MICDAAGGDGVISDLFETFFTEFMKKLFSIRVDIEEYIAIQLHFR